MHLRTVSLDVLDVSSSTRRLDEFWAFEDQDHLLYNKEAVYTIKILIFFSCISIFGIWPEFLPKLLLSTAKFYFFQARATPQMQSSYRKELPKKGKLFTNLCTSKSVILSSMHLLFYLTVNFCIFFFKLSAWSVTLICNLCMFFRLYWCISSSSWNSHMPFFYSISSLSMLRTWFLLLWFYFLLVNCMYFREIKLSNGCSIMWLCKIVKL